MDEFDDFIPCRANITQTVPVFMITVPENFNSLYYAEKTMYSWKTRGYAVRQVPALKAEDDYYLRHASKFTTIERTFGREGKREFYKSEISRFLSHVKLWEHMSQKNISRMFIIEHDCELVNHVPSKFINTNIGFLARSSMPSFFTNYTSCGIKSCAGYYIRIDYAQRLLEDFYSLPTINFSIEKYLYVMSIFDGRYSATHFAEALRMPAQEIYDAEIGNTVKDER